MTRLTGWRFGASERILKGRTRSREGTISL